MPTSEGRPRIECGSLYMNDGADAVTIAGANTFVTIAGGDVTVGGSSVLITESASAGTLTVVNAGKYLVNYSAAVTDASGSKLIQSIILVGSTEQANTQCETTSTANTPQCVAGSGILSLSRGDAVSLALANATDTTDLVVDQMTLTLVGLDVD